MKALEKQSQSLDERGHFLVTRSWSTGSRSSPSSTGHPQTCSFCTKIRVFAATHALALLHKTSTFLNLNLSLLVSKVVKLTPLSTHAPCCQRPPSPLLAKEAAAAPRTFLGALLLWCRPRAPLQPLLLRRLSPRLPTTLIRKMLKRPRKN